MSAVECFELLYNDDIIKFIVDMSNLYALQRNHTLNVTCDEIRVYIAILLLTGYLTPKYMRMLWEVKSDTHNDLVASSIRRNRFFEIQQYLHLSDSTSLPPNDKFAKVREYFTKLNVNFTAHFKKAGSSHISIDETIVPYFGRHGTKQHIHGKPIRFGYKLWSAATRHGYLVNCEPYQGASGPGLKMQSDFSLGAAVILELHSRLPEELGPYNLYFDNFFTGLPLLKYLREQNVGGTGTVRENRLENCNLPYSKDMKKEPRGKLCHKDSKEIIAAKWHDNNIVTIASNCHGLDPITKVDRIGFVDKKRAKIQVDCPAVIKMYNKYMGGVDHFDENVDSMRVALPGKKWWFPLFAFGLDAACQNAWLIKRQSENNWTYCDFRRNVVTVYLQKYGKPASRNSSCGVPVQIRVPAARANGIVSTQNVKPIQKSSIFFFSSVSTVSGLLVLNDPDLMRTSPVGAVVHMSPHPLERSILALHFPVSLPPPTEERHHLLTGFYC
ncbi:piggyBac transposable element-derived protein 3-like [Diorhabda sublineata]|uniref:piggyBac transposable element-derived protein 3-like n=1 Tax=Diorhabda sublineata TaxID=1163346 RepID=UPI0024E04A09|nr:piggyBac transposable element-derived protein 3-like [Diorhabda sublineata]XP_056647452.1 piggyBac transposable element-derived protein 3-like [Diorhabda sublineata]